ncbi:MAG TPA: phage major capsid protein [Candidatus Hydrogenedentes bacterium]|nr:phage major capsid protein [Candidatus Hydrogenedentota bacterium]HOS01431.1 phage major capsid protein [Candidatus Hydrogenedentota bacterium]
MGYREDMVKERVGFLSRDPEKLRQTRGRDLYDTLQGLGLSYGQYFRALGTNLQDYCAQEFGVDVNRITVDRFFQSDANAKWLFPDMVREAVVSGMKRKPVYRELIIRDTPIEGTAYDVPYVEENAAEEELRSVAEGAAIPESEITYGDRIVRLDKKGRGVVASYEVVRRMSVDMLRVHLQRIGERLGRSLDARLAQVLVSGDNSGSGTAAATVNTATANTWAYGDVLSGFMKLTMDHYFTPTHMLANGALAQTILQLDEFKDSALFDFAKSGNLPTPVGVKLVPLADQPANKLTILDAGYAVEKLTEQDLLVESDKLINQQWDRTYLTVVTDFAVIYEKARVVVQSDWS